jgi:outer membrane protein OmpA-like peptidoglycan-associated protein
MHRLAVPLLVLSATMGTAHAADPASQRYVIYFQEWSAAVDKPAQDLIAQVAAMARTQGGPIHVIGFADPNGSKAANILLSELRAQRVIDLLSDAGVAPARLVSRGKGPVQYAMTSLESRRVEISFEKR